MFNLFNKSTKSTKSAEVKKVLSAIEQIKMLGVEVQESPRPGSNVVTLFLDVQDLEEIQDKILDILKQTGNFPALTGGAIHQEEWSSKKFCVNYAVIKN